MADTVTTQTLENGSRNLVMKFTNESDGTGEAAVAKVTASDYTPNPGTHLTINRVWYDIKAGGVRILWDATADVDALILSGFGTLDFRDFAGITNNGGAGVTGNILFTTVGFAANSSYTVVLEMKKNV